MLTVTSLEIRLSCLPAAFDGFRIIHLSDLHGRRFGKANSLLLQAVLEQSPDLVVATGDMLDRKHEGGAAFLELVHPLAVHVPVYAIRGNHEQYMADHMDEAPFLAQYEKELRDAGVTLLDDRAALFFRDGAHILFYGITLPRFCYKPQAAKAPYACLPPDAVARHVGLADESHCGILLAHSPLFFHSYADWGADLVLSGHMHGGLIRVPGVGGLLSPYHHFFPRYDAGLHVLGDAKLVVSRGLGDSPLRVRICNPPEIVVVTLRAEHAQAADEPV
ncbi:metallophosphoesterase [Ethanoligenens harbinense]|uniref:metallophosphoesterase n=1 Tax=Ethanoligenens harbinense TaxID=253239 RepID=UPI0001C51BAE|nr:metallophosphoesterase [Ethanoligenens harbinense]